MTTEEIKVKFTADINKFKQDLADMKKELTKTNEQLGDISKTFKSIEAPIKSMAKDLSTLTSAFKEFDKGMLSVVEKAQKEKQAVENSRKATEEMNRVREASAQAMKEQANASRELNEALNNPTRQTRPSQSSNSNGTNSPNTLPWQGGTPTIDVGYDTSKAQKIANGAMNSSDTEAKKMGAELDKAIAQYHKLKESAQKQAQDLARVNSQLEMQAQKVSIANSKYDEQEQKISTIESRNAELSRIMDYHDFDGSMKEGLEELKQRMEEATTRAEAMKEALSNAFGNSVSFDGKNTPISDFKDQLAEAESDLKHATADYDELRNAVTGVKSSIQGMPKDMALEALANEAETAKVRLDQLGVGVDSANARFDQLKATQGSVSARLEGTKASMGSTESKIKGLSGALSSAKMKFQMLKSAVSSGMGKLAQFGTTALSVAKRLNIAGNMVSALGKRISGMGAGIKQTARMVKSILISFALRGVMQAFTSGLGDFAQKSKAVNSDLSRLKSSFDYMGSSFVSAFQPILHFVTPVLEKLCDTIAEVMNKVAEFNAVLTGANAFQKATKVQKDYASSVQGSAKANKDLKNAILGFDEMTKIGDEDKDSGGDSGGSWETTNVNASNKLADMIKAGDWDGVAKALAEKMNGAVESVDWSGLGKKLGTCFNTSLSALHTFVKTFDWENLGAGIGKFISNTITTIDWGELARTISDIFISINKMFTSAVKNIDWSGVGHGIWDFITNIDVGGILASSIEGLSTLAFGLVKTLGTLIADAFKGIKTYFEDEIEACGGDIWKGIGKGILDAIVGIGTWIKENIFDPFIQGFKNVFEIHSPSRAMKPLGENIIEGVKEGITSKFEVVRQAIQDLKNTIMQKWGEVKLKFSVFCATAVSTVKQWCQERHAQWKDKTTSFKARVDTTTSSIRSWWNERSGQWKDKSVSFTIKAKNSVNELKESFRSAINTVIGWINQYIIDSLNKLSIKIPTLKVAGKTILKGCNIGFDLSHISSFKEGGFPDGENGLFFANSSEMVGKFTNGKTAVANNDQIVQGITNGVFSGVVSAMQMAGNNSAAKPIVNVYVGNKAVTDYVVEDVNRRTIATGTCPILV